MSEDRDEVDVEELAARRKTALELVFISLVGLVVLGGFIAALTYGKSSRLIDRNTVANRGAGKSHAQKAPFATCNHRGRKRADRG